MATLLQYPTYNANPPYFGMAWHDPGGAGYENWATIRPTGLASLYSLRHSQLGKQLANQYTTLHRQMVCVDLSALGAINVTSAEYRCTVQYTPADTWATYSDSNKGLVLTLIDDGTKTVNSLETADFAAAYNNFTPASNVILRSSISQDYECVFTLNAAGIAYLNTVATKSDFQGYAYFCIAINGDVENNEPADADGTISYEYYSVPETGTDKDPYFTMEYNEYPDVKINIGDSWKTVESIQINIGDAWKDVVDLNVNIGDVWKGL